MSSKRDVHNSSVYQGASPGAHSARLALDRRLASPILTLLAAVAMIAAVIIAVQPTWAQDNGPIQYAENGTGAVATFTATDPEGKSTYWNLSGDDEEDFSISDSGVLTFQSSPNFEAPADADTNNTYAVTVEACDVSSCTDDTDEARKSIKAVTIEVTNVEEAATTAIALKSLQPPGLHPHNSVVYPDSVGNPYVAATGDANIAIADPDGSVTNLKWQWSKSTSKTGTFTDITGAAAKTVTYTPDSGDVGQYLRLTLTYDDGEGKGKTLTATSAYHVLSSRSANASPAFQDDFDPNTTGNQEPAADLDDGATDGDNVGSAITASDSHNDRLTYSLEAVSGSGADADVFQIDRKTGQVTVGLGKIVSPSADSSEPDTVTKQDTFTVTIKATDPHGTSDTATLTITMKNTDEAPVFTASKAAHSRKENIAGNTDNAAIYTFAAYNPEAGTVTYSLNGNDASKLSIASNGALTFDSGALPNFEAPGDADKDNVYEVTVKASDASTPPNSTTLAVTVTVTNDDETGTVTLSASQPRIGVEITANTPTDPDGGVTGVTWQWSKADESGGTYADIKDATMASYTPVTADDGDYLKATATYTDNQGSKKQAASANLETAVAKVRNLAPVFTDENANKEGLQINPRTVAENSAAGTNVGAAVVATDTADADSTDDGSIFYLLGGTDAASFAINSSSGQITVGTGATLDYETKKEYMVTVTARDPEGLKSSVPVTINVSNVDDAPAISGPSSATYAENGTGTVATFSATDPEGGTTYWHLRGTDAEDFNISDSGVLTFTTSPNYESPADDGTNNTYNVIVVTCDIDDCDNDTAEARTSTKAVTVDVTNVDEAATTGIALSSLQPRASVDITVAYPDSLGNPFVNNEGTANSAIADPDGSVTNTKWQWSKSTSKSGTFTGHRGSRR